jgi:hypothetical protein
LTGLPLYEAVLDLCQHLRLEPPQLPPIHNSRNHAS